MQKQILSHEPSTKKLLSADDLVNQCKINLQGDLQKNTRGKVGFSLIFHLWVMLDKYKKKHKKTLKVKNNWKVKYLKLKEKYKKLKEVSDFERYLP